MRVHSAHRTSARFFLAASVLLSFCLYALAVPNGKTTAAQGGTLTTAERTVLINGVPAQAGASVPSGSTVSTVADGDALVDLGALGKVLIRPSTVAKLDYGSGSVEVTLLECGSVTHTVPSGVTGRVKTNEPVYTEVVVSRGEVIVNQEDRKGNSKDKRIKAENGDPESENVYNTKSVEADKDEETVYTVNCCQCCFVERRLPGSK